MTTCFLNSRPEITKRIRRLFRKADEICCVVAFWGRGADELFHNVDESIIRKIRIVCNLTSGGTNPGVIDKLRAKGFRVKHSSILHSKVYWTNHGIVVGSANASANGLSLESIEQDGWLEAAIHSTRSADIKVAGNYVNQIWYEESDEITEQDLMNAKVKWKDRRPFPPQNKGIDFITALRNGMFTDRENSVFFVIDMGNIDAYLDDINAHAEKLKKRYRELHDRKLEAWVDWQEIPREEYIVDYWLDPQGKLEFCKIWKTLPENCDRDGLKGHTYQYAYPVHERKIGMTVKQRNQMKKIIRYIARNHPETLDPDLHAT